MYDNNKLFKETNAMTVKQVYIFSLIMHLYQNISSSEKINHHYLTRNRTKGFVSINTAKKTVGSRYFDFIAPRLYNFQIKIKTINSVELIKCRFKKYIKTLNNKDINALLGNRS